jgi:hypothetical protein
MQPSSGFGRAIIATAVAAEATQPSSDEWIIDTGATYHMTGDATILQNVRESSVRHITFENGMVGHQGVGTGRQPCGVCGEGPEVCTLQGVLLLEDMRFQK